MDWNVGEQQDTGYIQKFQPDKYMTDSDNESDEEGDFKVSLWQDLHDQLGKISRRSSLVRLDLWGCCHNDGYTT